jgi:hypothetical protein
MRATSDRAGPEAEAPRALSTRPAPRAGSLTELSSGGGAHALQHAIGNAAMGRLLRGRMLARDSVRAMDAPAEREIGPNDRPPAKAFFEAYSKVSYDVWKKGVNPSGVHPEKQQNGPWEFIGGSVGKMFGATDPDNPAAGPHRAEHTCAGRVSWALNHGFAATQIKSGAMFYNDPKVTYAGKPGDGKNYIVGAPAMQTYLTKMWGPPDVKLSNLDLEGIDVSTRATIKTEGDASALRTRLGPTGVAIFAGAHHTGVISQQLKTDDYVYYDPTVVPAVAWILP